jgi:hypothetical protein
MKKLIAISVVFALIAGVAFAVDIGGNVIGTAYVLQGDTGKDENGDAHKVTSGGEMNRLRIDGSGEAGDGTFGGYIRFEPANWGIDPEKLFAVGAEEGEEGEEPGPGEIEKAFSFGSGVSGNVWWKPIDQFKLLIGGNGGDGFIGKEGVTGWSFQQTVYDTGVAAASGNIWGGGYGATTYRSVFFEQGDGQHDVYLFITPADIVSINVILPFISKAGQETGDVFKQTIGQLDFHLDFGNIALTYVGNLMKGNDQPKFFLYYGGSFGDLSLDVGLSYQLAHSSEDGGDGAAQPIGIGLGLKYTMDSFGVKFRTAANVAGDVKATKILAEVLPYFGLGDNLTAFVSAGLSMNMPDGQDTVIGWHFNPYLQVGEEWGAKFLAGVKVWSDGSKDADDKTTINWAVPVALIVSF